MYPFVFTFAMPNLLTSRMLFQIKIILLLNSSVIKYFSFFISSIMDLSTFDINLQTSLQYVKWYLHWYWFLSGRNLFLTVSILMQKCGNQRTKIIGGVVSTSRCHGVIFPRNPCTQFRFKGAQWEGRSRWVTEVVPHLFPDSLITIPQ